MIDDSHELLKGLPDYAIKVVVADDQLEAPAPEGMKVFIDTAGEVSYNEHLGFTIIRIGGIEISISPKVFPGLSW